MKKIFIIASLLLLAVSQPRIVNAQAQQPNTGITISPATTIIYENDFGSEYTITIENNSDSDLSIIPTEKYVQKDESGNIIPIDLKDQEYLDFEREEFTLKSKSRKKVPVRIRLIYKEIKAYPAVSFKVKGDPKGVTLGSELLSVFVLQNVNGQLNIDTQVNATTGVIFTPEINLEGTIDNVGEKFFNPSGTVAIFKNDQLIYEKQITSQIEGLLFPNESKEFGFSWLNEQNLFDSFGSYRMEVRIKPSPYSQIYGTKINFFYIPVQLLAIIIAIIAGASISLLLVQKLSKKKKSK